LSSFADGSDCPTIGPDGECCRCIGQALVVMMMMMMMVVMMMMMMIINFDDQ